MTKTSYGSKLWNQLPHKLRRIKIHIYISIKPTGKDISVLSVTCFFFFFVFRLSFNYNNFVAAAVRWT